MTPLAQLLENATPGPWGDAAWGDGNYEDDRRLILLAPDLARLVLEAEGTMRQWKIGHEWLASLAALNERLEK
jgi:hypothetical protein